MNLQNRNRILVGAGVWIAGLLGSLRLMDVAMPSLHGLCGGWG